MYSVTLFLGLEVTPVVEGFLAVADPALLKIFMKDDEIYLHDLSYEGKRYLGKFAGSQTDVASLEQLEINIRSLLIKILPSEDLSHFSLHLFPLVEARGHARK